MALVLWSVLTSSLLLNAAKIGLDSHKKMVQNSYLIFCTIFLPSLQPHQSNVNSLTSVLEDNKR